MAGSSRRSRRSHRSRRVRLLMVLGVVAAVAGGAYVARKRLGLTSPHEEMAAGQRAAAAALSEGRPEEAEVHLRVLLQGHPGNPSLHYQLGLVLDRQERDAEASAAMRRAVELRPDHVEARLYLAYRALREGRIDEAKQLGEEVLRVPAAPPTAHLLLAQVALTPEHASTGAAFAHAESAVERMPQDDVAHEVLAEASLRLGDVDDARARRGIRVAHAHLQKVVEEGRASDAQRMLAARCALALGEPQRARSVLEPRLRGAAVDAGLRVLAAKALWETGDHEIARMEFDAVARDATAPDILLAIETFHRVGDRGALADAVLTTAAERFPQDRATALRAVGRKLQARDGDAAAAAARTALAAHPNDAELILALAVALSLSPATREEMERVLRDAAAAEPLLVLPTLRLADVLLDGAGEPLADGVRAEVEGLVARARSVQLDRAAAARRDILEGRLHLAGRRLAEASAALETAAEAVPEDPEPHVWLARVYALRGLPGREAAALTQLLRTTDDRPAVLVARADALLRAARAADAERDAREVLAGDPDDVRAMQLLARARLERQPPDPVGAREVLVRAAACDDAPLAVHLLLARACAESGDVGAARHALEAARALATDESARLAVLAAEASLPALRADAPGASAGASPYAEFVAAHPEDAGALELHGHALLEAGDVAGARAAFEELVRLRPETPSGWRALVHASLSDDGGTARDVDRAKAAAERIRELAPDTVEDLASRGAVALQSGDAAGAAELLARAVEIAPRDTWAMLLHGVALWRTGDRDAARLALERSAELAPAAVLPRRLLARLGFETARDDATGDPPGAVAKLRDAVRADPGEPAYQAALAWAALAAGAAGSREHLVEARDTARRLAETLARVPSADPDRLAEACIVEANASYALGDHEALLEAARRLVELRPDDPVSHTRFASALWVSGDRAGALAELERAAARFPESAWVFGTRVGALHHAGRTADALALARERAKRRPDDADAQQLLGSTALAAGDSAAARTAYRRALELDADRLAAADGMLRAAAREKALAAAADEVERLLVRSTRRDEAAVVASRARVLAEPRSAPARAALRAALERRDLDPSIRLAGDSTLLEASIVAGDVAGGAAHARRFSAWAENEPLLAPGRPLAPYAADAFRAAGDLLASSGPASLAEAAYTDALARAPDSVEVLNNLAMLLATDARRAPEAVDLATRAVALLKDSAVVHDTLGQALLGAGRHADARRELEEAIRLWGDPPQHAPSAARTWLALARALAEADDAPGARSAMERAAALDETVQADTEFRALQEEVRSGR